MMKTLLLTGLLSFGCITMVGCDSGGGSSVVEQPEKTPEQLQAELDAYNASMDADAASSEVQQ